MKQQAQAEAKRSEEVARFLKEMLGGVGPSAALGRDTTMLREILDKTAERVGKDLKGQPEVEAELRSTTGDVYWALGQYTNAETMHRAALTIRRGLWGNLNTNVAHSLDGVGGALQGLGALEQAEPLLQEALMIRTNRLGFEHLEVATSLSLLGYQRFLQTRAAEADDLFRSSLAIRRKFLGAEDPDVAAVLGPLSAVLNARGKLGEAESAAREALAIRRKQSGGESTFDDEGTAVRLAVALRFQGRTDEAETVLRQALETESKVYGSDNPLLCSTKVQLSFPLMMRDQLEEAERLARESLALSQDVPHKDAQAGCLNTLGHIFRKRGKPVEAENAFHEALLVWEQYPVATPDEANARYYRANVLCEQGKVRAAEALYRDGIAAQRKIATQVARQRETRMLLALAGFLRDQGKPVQAEAVFREGLASGSKTGTVDDLARVMADYSDLLRTQSRMSEAESISRQALALCRERPPNNFEVCEWLASGLAAALMVQGRSAEAETALRQNVEFTRKSGGSTALANSLASFGDFLRNNGKLTEAEALYREAVTNSARPYRNDLAQWQSQFDGLVEVLVQQGKTGEVDKVNGELSQIAPKIPQVAILSALADAYGHQAKWKETIAYLAKVIDLEPTNKDSYHKISSALVFTGESERYAQLRRKMFEDFAASKDPYACERSAKACLILPRSAADYLIISNWAQIAVSPTSPDVMRPCAQSTMGHAEYDLGHFAEAVEWEQKSASTAPFPVRDVQTYCILAMAHHQLRHTAEARAALAKAAEITRTKLPPLDSGRAIQDWWDYLLAHMLLREAQALIDGEPQTEAAKP